MPFALQYDPILCRKRKEYLRCRLILIAMLLIPPRLAHASPAQKPGVHARIEVSGRRFFPGEVFKIRILCSIAARQIEASFAGRRIILTCDNNREKWEGLAGIDLEMKPGRYSVQADLHFENGETGKIEDSVTVLYKKFPVQRITVKEKYVTPEAQDAKRAEEEARRLEAIWKAESAERLWQGRFLKPVASELTSAFGRRRIVNNQPRSPHSGVDFQAGIGTPIQAANFGMIVLAEDLFFSGNTVVLDHGLGLYTFYGHCSKILVKQGENVRKGQVIAEVGATGRVTGPHLHWACRLNEARVNPLNLTYRLLDRDDEVSRTKNARRNEDAHLF